MRVGWVNTIFPGPCTRRKLKSGCNCKYSARTKFFRPTEVLVCVHTRRIRGFAKKRRRSTTSNLCQYHTYTKKIFISFTAVITPL